MPPLVDSLALLLLVPPPVTLLAAYGGVLATKAATTQLRAVTTRRSPPLRALGRWGVVTEATDGIGRSLALELARRDLNVLLLARSRAQLEDVVDQVRAEKPGAEVRAVAVDFTRLEQDGDAREEVARVLREIQDIGVLVNNAGGYTSSPSATDDASAALAMASTSFVTQLVLPGMAQRQRGAVVNVSAGVGSPSSPAALFLAQMTRALAEPNRAHHVSVQCHQALLVATKRTKIRRPSLLAPSPAVFARTSVDRIANGSKRMSSDDVVVAPYWPHAVQLWLMERLPSVISDKVRGTTEQAIRTRAMDKLATKAIE